MNTSLSNTVVVNGDNYEVEIYLLRDPSDKDGAVVPIGYNNIKYLEITNDLANLGYHGKVAFVNYGDILEELGVLKASKKIPLMYFRFRSLAFSSNTTYDDIYFTAALTQGQDIKEDEVTGLTTYNFEELYVFKLKTNKLLRKDNESINYNNASAEKPGKGTVSEALKILLRGNTLDGSAVINGELIDPTISSEIIETGIPLEDEVNPNDIISLKSNTLLYDAINQMSSYLSYKPQNSDGEIISIDWYDPGMIKLENSFTNKPGNSKGSRKFVMFPLLTTINKFFNMLSTGRWTQGETDPAKKYFDKFLTEKFNLSQKSQTQVGYSNNTITKYELKRVDLTDVLAGKWTGIQLDQSIECGGTIIKTLGGMKRGFELLCTAPYISNLPLENDNIVQYSRPSIPTNLAVSYGTNSVFKSFIFDNVLATFRVNGQPYRKPNRFIAINTPLSDGKINPIKGKEKAEIEGFWYIISVNHVFVDGNYFNDFECVRIYQLGGTASQPGSVAPTPTLSPTLAGNTNGPGETPLPVVAPDTSNPLPAGKYDEGAPSVLPSLEENNTTT